MDKLSQISLENTVTLKIDYLLNQELLLNNFQIIMDCLKDLQSQINKHSSDIAGINTLKDSIEKLGQQVKQNSSILNNQGKENQNNQNSNSNSNALDQNPIDNLQKQIKELKDRMTKGEGFTTQNTKDINLLMSDMKNAKQQIQSLKRQLSALKISSGTNGSNGNSANSDKNLRTNGNLNQQTLNQLNQQSQSHHQAIKKFEKEMNQMKNHIKKLEDDITGLKTDVNQVLEDKKIEDSVNLNENTNSNDVTIDGKTLNEIMKKIQYLNKKAENIQSQVLNNTRCLHELNQTAEKTNQELDQQKDSINGIHLEIQEINKILEQLQNLNNNDNDNLQSEIQKLKEQYEKLLKMINALKINTKSQTDSIEDKNSGSNRNINSKISQERSFRKRSDSVDLNGKIRQLTDRIRHLEKLMQSQNPQKLPPIGWKKPNQTSYNPQKSHKKQIAQMKNDLEIWIKSYLDSLNKGQGNLAQIQLKIQQIKNILGRKADHEGMKKGLAFLQGKITQLYMFLTEPESQDAMIVRKGFNCLSCSKKVENLRGKLGPRMNWDNLNVNHGQTPPKAGFPKYADSNDKESI